MSDTHPHNVPALLREIAANARSGNDGTASALLNRAVLLIQAELSKGTAKPEALGRIVTLLDTLLSAQKRGDWVAFADIIEYSFIDFWQTNFQG